ncbi:hypothetical protein [Streptomyces sp. NPDC097619]|uniref:hypothetical protein n=1 Tax=Streptomyces sp. NPDC097619 TaxID=3157228 RepID=UPI00331CAC85
MSEPWDVKGPKLPPGYPPRTPTPPKRPVQVPPPERDSEPVPTPPTRPRTGSLVPVGLSRPQPLGASTRMRVRDRRVANWALSGDCWAAAKAVRSVAGKVREWGYDRPADGALAGAVRLLVGAALTDGGRRISVHLADQDGRVLIVVLSHTVAATDSGLLARLAAVEGTASCGTEASEEGRRVWALLDTRLDSGLGTDGATDAGGAADTDGVR